MPDPRNDRLWETAMGCLNRFGTFILGAAITAAAMFAMRGCQ